MVDAVWHLCFQLSGQLNELNLPPVAALTQGQDLWQHSCFEMFVKSAGSSYREFNFAPSGASAAYDFKSYRDGQFQRPESLLMSAEAQRDAGMYRLELQLRADGLPWPAQRLGFSCVIEDQQQRKAYWALQHAPGPADFHHSDNFQIELPA